MWERYSYFGNRALLVLFLVSRVGGFGLDDQTATAIYGLFTASTYLAGLPGGWLADRWLGARRAVIIGGGLITIGNLLLAIPGPHSLFYAGLCVIVAGVGLLKPNVSCLVGDVFRGDHARRDGGFTLYYMGICIGAALAGIVSPIVAAAFGWRWGYAAAALGMTIGLIQFCANCERSSVPLPARGVDGRERLSPLVIAASALAAGIALVLACRAGVVATAASAVWLVGLAGAAFFGWALIFGGFNRSERRRLAVVALLCTACALFWSGADLAGSALNLFAERNTERHVAAISLLGRPLWGAFEVPAGLFQSVNPALIIALGPIASLIWSALAKRGRDLSAPAKFAWGLMLMGLGLLVMAPAAQLASTGAKVGPIWLLTSYALQTAGELALSPVGLSAVSRLAPPRIAGQLLGAWFLSVALGTLIAARLAGGLSAGDPGAMAGGYLLIGAVPIVGGAVLLAISGRIRRIVGDAEEDQP